MSAKAGSKRAGGPVRVASNGIDRARRGSNGRASAGGDRVRGALPMMRASARRRKAVHASEDARAPRKSKRAKRAPTLGGRLAAAIRMTRLRASRSAEEFRMRR